MAKAFHQVIYFVFIYSKYIYPLLPPFKNDFVFLLSNLFILEFVFNMQGIIQFLFKKAFISPPAAFIILVMIILPFYAIFQIISFMMNRWQKQLKGAAL